MADNNQDFIQVLLEKIEKDDLPTNVFDVEGTDPLVLLGKMNEIISQLENFQSSVNTSNSTANEALSKAEDAVDTSGQALSNANTALGTANQAIGTANTAIETANQSLETAQDAGDVAGQALSNSNTAIDTANTAIDTANTALEQVTQGLGTKVYDNSGNLLNETTFTGSNGINVDMDATSHKNFVVSIDQTITDQIEQNKNNIDNEATARQSADTTLQNNIDNEATARQSADTTLQNNIDSEATARQSADTTLQNQIDTLNDISETIVFKGNTIPGVNYIKYNSGILICWGTVTPSSNGTLIILPTPFVNTDYSVGATNNTIKNNQIRALATTNYTTSSFKTVGQYSQSNSGYTDGDVTFSWIAIGFWK